MEVITREEIREKMRELREKFREPEEEEEEDKEEEEEDENEPLASEKVPEDQQLLMKIIDKRVEMIRIHPDWYSDESLGKIEDRLHTHQMAAAKLPTIDKYGDYCRKKAHLMKKKMNEYLGILDDDDLYSSEEENEIQKDANKETEVTKIQSINGNPETRSIESQDSNHDSPRPGTSSDSSYDTQAPSGVTVKETTLASVEPSPSSMERSENAPIGRIDIDVLDSIKEEENEEEQGKEPETDSEDEADIPAPASVETKPEISRPESAKSVRPTSAKSLNSARPISASSKKITSRPASANSRPASAGSRPASANSRQVSATSGPESVGSRPASASSRPASSKPSSVSSRPTSASSKTSAPSRPSSAKSRQGSAKGSRPSSAKMESA